MITRYITAQPATWASEVATLAFAWLVFFGAAACFKYKLHPSIDMLVARLPRAAAGRRCAGSTTRWCSAFCAFMVWFGTRFAIDAWYNPSPVLRLPLTWLYGPVAFCFALMIAALPARCSGAGSWTARRAAGKPMWADWIPGILMLVLFALEMPISFAIAISALSFFLIDGTVPLNIFVQKMVERRPIPTRCWRFRSSCSPARS